jgi:hypothetical protein
MTGALIAVAAILAVLGWLLLGGRGGKHEPTVHRRHDEDVDVAELEEAEREVQDAPDAESVRDWGPGAGKPRPPEML